MKQQLPRRHHPLEVSYIPKIGCHHFCLGLIALPKNMLPSNLKVLIRFWWVFGLWGGKNLEPLRTKLELVFGPPRASLVRFLWVLVGAPLWWGPLWLFFLGMNFFICAPKKTKKNWNWFWKWVWFSKQEPDFLRNRPRTGTKICFFLRRKKWLELSVNYRSTKSCKKLIWVWNIWKTRTSGH